MNPQRNVGETDDQKSGARRAMSQGPLRWETLFDLPPPQLLQNKCRIGLCWRCSEVNAVRSAVGAPQRNHAARMPSRPVPQALLGGGHG